MKKMMLLLACTGFIVTVSAKHDHDDDHWDRGRHGRSVVVEKVVVEKDFSDNDREVIVRYFEREHKRIPPGHRKKWRHYQISVGEVPEPTVRASFAPLPPALMPLLPPPPPGIELFMAGDQVVRVDKHSRRVVSCLPIPVPVPVPMPPIR